MKRFSLFLVALVVVIPFAGCESEGTGGAGGSSATVSNAPDPHVPGEAKAYQAKQAEKQAAAAAKIKVANPGAKKH